MNSYRQNLAKSLGLEYQGLVDMMPWNPVPYLNHLFMAGNKKIWIEYWYEEGEAWSLAAEEFLKGYEEVEE